MPNIHEAATTVNRILDPLSTELAGHLLTAQDRVASAQHEFAATMASSTNENTALIQKTLAEVAEAIGDAIARLPILEDAKAQLFDDWGADPKTAAPAGVPQPAPKPSELQTRQTAPRLPFNPNTNVLSESVQGRLDTPLKTLLDDDLVTKLRRRGLHTVRDVIVGGEEYLLWDANIGRHTYATLKQRISAFCPDVPIRDNWRPEEVAKFCTSLDQVPIYALRITKFDYAAPPGYKAMDGQRITVADVLNSGRWWWPKLDPDFKPLAQRFAVAFQQARQQLGGRA